MSFRVVRMARPAAATLLDHMGQLMGQQPTAGLRGRAYRRSAKKNMVADRVRVSTDPGSRSGRTAIGVHSHLAEVTAEGRPEKRLVAAAQ